MAWLETTKNGYYQIVFRFDGERYKKGLNTRDVRLADAQKLRVDENIQLVKRPTGYSPVGKPALGVVKQWYHPVEDKKSSTGDS